MENKLICQCCGMPLDESTFSKEIDGKINNKYCKWCYVDGKYTYTNMEDLINVCVKHMVPRFTESEARNYMKNILPNLEYWKNK